MQNVLLVSDDLVDQSSYYRLLGPYSHLRGEFHFTAKAKPNAAEIWLCDILIIERPNQPHSLDAIRFARSIGKDVIVDYDDDFLNVPDYHSEIFSSLKNLQILKECISLASFITTSTESIAKSLYPIAPCNIEVIPNAFDDYLGTLPEKWNGDEGPVLWRGGSAHYRDLDLLAEMGVVPGVLIGSVRPVIAKRYPNATIYPFMAMQDYTALLKRIKPSCFVVPLLYNPFNIGKSNCAWIEATACGALTFASALPEFNQPGVAQYGMPIDTTTPDSRFKKTRAAIPLLSKVNEKRKSLLHSLRR